MAGPERGRITVLRSDITVCLARIRPSGTCPGLDDGHTARCRGHHGSAPSSGCLACWQTGRRNGVWPNRRPERLVPELYPVPPACPAVRWPARSHQCGSSQQIPKQSRTLMGLLRRPLHHNRTTGAGNLDADGATLV